MPKIRTFNGGLQTALEPHLIAENEAAEYENVSHLRGHLAPMGDLFYLFNGAKRYGFYFPITGLWYWSDTPKDWVQFQERLYIGNRSGVSTKLINGVEYNLGIAKPTGLLRGLYESYSFMTYLQLSTDAAIGDIPAGTLMRYIAVNYDFSTSPSTVTISEPFDFVPQASNLSVKVVIPAANLEIKDQVHIYREYEGTYYLLRVIQNSGEGFIDDTLDISGTIVTLDLLLEDTSGAKTKDDLTPVTYAMTYYNSNDGTESAPIFSNEYPLAPDIFETWLFDVPVSSDPQVTSKRIYRIGRDLTSYTLVATINNADTYYIDTLEDTQLPGSILDAQDNLPPPATGMSHLTEAYAMLFAIDGDKLIYTPIGKPNYWPATYFIDFPRQLTGIAKTAIGLLVFDNVETWLVTGTGPLTLAKQQLTGSQGCLNGDTVVNVQGAAWWVSADGVCVSNGGEVKVFTRDKLEWISPSDWGDCVNAVVHDDMYFLAREGIYTSALVVDAHRNVVKEVDWNVEAFFTAENYLYGYNSSSGGILGEYIGDREPISFTSMTYLSPKYYGNGMTDQKVYKNFYIVSSGTVTVQVLINDAVVVTKTVSGFDNHQIKIPADKTRGLFVQFRITGTGTVFELGWDEGSANV